MTECPEHASQLHAFYQKKRDYFCSLLAASKFKLSPSSGTYFQLVDYSEISEAQDTEFADWLTIEAGVAAIPLKPFYDPNNLPHHSHFIRFCFCKDDSTLREASARLCSL
jgi:methionine aminotransferase